MSLSLEEQRRALLEQIEASRAIYRRMLTGETVSSGARAAPGARIVVTQGATDIPARQGRSQAMATAASRARELRTQALHWATEHPLWVAGGVTLLVLLLPRMAAARRARNSRRYGTRDAASHEMAGKTGKSAHALQPQGMAPLREQVRDVQSLGIGRALLAASLLLLRDPARLKAASRLAGLAWHWLKRRRAPPAMPTPVSTGSVMHAAAMPAAEAPHRVY